MSKQTHDRLRHNSRAGFTLLELMIVTMIIGILSAIAVPAFQGVQLKADAARLVSDAHTVSLASYEFLSESGSFPSSGAPGTVPPELAGVLGAGFPFTYKDVKFQWISINFPDRNNFWQTRNLGILLLDYSARPEMADPMYSHRGGDAHWAPDVFYFLYRG